MEYCAMIMAANYICQYLFKGNDSMLLGDSNYVADCVKER